jgi:predicted transposase YdaD
MILHSLQLHVVDISIYETKNNKNRIQKINHDEFDFDVAASHWHARRQKTTKTL